MRSSFTIFLMIVAAAVALPQPESPALSDVENRDGGCQISKQTASCGQCDDCFYCGPVDGYDQCGKCVELEKWMIEEFYHDEALLNKCYPQDGGMNVV